MSEFVIEIISIHCYLFKYKILKITLLPVSLTQYIGNIFNNQSKLKKYRFINQSKGSIDLCTRTCTRCLR